ncbi:MAG: tetraacyldisaccharide 4'-kinase [Ignavibacteria bacterium]|nr:MAG: tetraacyldisaccharide 4'-kinase [Ignavibacteria bacterium]KAF0160387.1 MAG: tetraacyldisaccharide 4'-kinase [Ignavibacteria bacterium]
MLELLRIIFSPFAFIYAVIIRVRNYLFDKNIFRVRSVKAKVISVGNITVGGSGKTPTVLMLGNMLKIFNKRIGILSRGYGRRSFGYLLVSNGNEIISKVEQCGDEIILVAEELKVPAAVCEKRAAGAEQLIEDTYVDTIILDDAFQHRWIYRDLDIVLVDQRFLLKVDFVEQNPIPLGMMREPFESLKRADIIILNRKFSEQSEIPAKLKRHFAGKEVFHGYYSSQGIYDVKTQKSFSLEDFRGQKSLVVCGIAKPHSFLKILEQNNIDITNKLLYPDHANYTTAEVQEIRKLFYDANTHSVLTTHKDAVKLKNFRKELDDIDIYYLKIEMKIEEQDKFNKLVLNSLK